MKKLKNLPIGVQSLREMLIDDYIYVDKTQDVYNLLNDAKYYFLSRPRRFGKSLLLDTIAETFCGDKELFKGLYIYDSDYNFEKHPVIRFDMSNIANDSPEALRDSISKALMAYAVKDDFDIEMDLPSNMFKNLIQALNQKYDKRVVVLIDEYDKPILDNITNVEVANANRSILGSFYGVLKSMDPHLRFTFLTGVTKFTKTSVFSGLNNLLDITLTEKYANICGIPVSQLDEYFSEHIEAVKGSKSLTAVPCIREMIIHWYDGYSWDGETRLINPFSLLTFFMQKRLSGYWYSSGSPRFLIELLKKYPADFQNLEKAEISERMMDIFDIGNISIIPLLFQTGYLTIDRIHFDKIPPRYALRIPNLEVKEALYLQVIDEFTENTQNLAEQTFYTIKDALETGDLEGILVVLKSLFASIPYQLHVSREAYYHSIFLALMSILGFETHAEVATARGCIDAVLETNDKVYIFEFKYADCPPDEAQEDRAKMFEKTLSEALTQIETKGYADKYLSSGKTIIKAAFAFLGRDSIEMLVK